MNFNFSVALPSSFPKFPDTRTNFNNNASTGAKLSCAKHGVAYAVHLQAFQIRSPMRVRQTMVTVLVLVQ